MPALRAPHIANVMAALDAGLCPDPGAAVRYGRNADGGWIVEVPRGARKALQASGWQPAEAPDDWLTAPCWPAMMPLESTGEPAPPLGEVIFISSAGEGFLTVAAELLRLGCDAVTVCRFGDQVACRVPEPPYFVVLRALDPASPLRAYGRTGHRVWTRLGFAHGRADLIDPPAGVHLLLDPEAWLSVPDGPWTDVHQHLVVSVRAPDVLDPRPLDATLSVALRLIRAPAGDAPTLWLITEDAHAQLDALVTRLPQAIVQRLLFAVAGTEDTPRILLRARRGRAGPPTLEVNATAFGSWMRVPNLLVPTGRTLDPPLRLMRVRQLLAPDPDVLVLLAPIDDAGGFRPLHIAEDAFAPLSDWVEYVIEAAPSTLLPWISDARFDFDAFTAMDVEWSEGPRTSKAPKPPPLPEPVDVPKARRSPRGPSRQVVAQPPRRATPPPLPIATLTVSQAQQAAAQAEAEFCALELPHDDPARGPLWARLGALQHAAGRPREAGLCWAHALWIAAPDARAALAQQWAQTTPKMPSGDAPPSVEQLRGLVAHALSGAESPKDAQRLLSQHGDALDLRAFWLASHALATRTDDRLGLMRARDAVFERLRGGLPLAANVPTFIRLHGVSDAQRTGVLARTLAGVMDRYLATRRERSEMEGNPLHTEGYVRLCVAWGHARLGQTELAKAERALALKRITPMDGVHGLCVALFVARVDQALRGRPPGAPLPADIQIRREALARIERFKADRMRELSRILDPRGTFDPFDLYQRADAHPYGEAFARLLSSADPAAVAEGLDTLLARDGAEKRTLLGAIDVLGTLPEALCVPRARAMIKQSSDLDPATAVEVLEALAVLVASLDRHDLVADALSALRAPASALVATDPTALAASLGRCAPTLRGAGHGADLRALFESLEGGLSADAIGGRVARLQLAAARAAMGIDDGLQPGEPSTHRVIAAFDAVFEVLDQVSNKHERYRYIRTLALALAQTTPAQAIAGVERLWALLPTVTDGFNTNSHFCLSVVQFMESIVLALASESLSLSPWARRWIEADEHALRRRVHQDIA